MGLGVLLKNKIEEEIGIENLNVSYLKANKLLKNSNLFFKSLLITKSITKMDNSRKELIITFL